MDELIGVIKMFAGNFAPEGYMLCQGQSLSITQNQALYAIIGNTYGGDYQSNTFQLPNLCGKTPKGVGTNTKGTEIVELGRVGGTESIVPTLPSNNGTPSTMIDTQFLGLNYIICVQGIFPSRP
jgi:microcystin-dependent protein